MAGFLEAGYGFFALIIVWNIFMLGFGGINDSSVISQSAYVAYSGGTIPNQPETTITPTTGGSGVAGENGLGLLQLGGGIQSTIDLAGRVLFGASNMIAQSGIPQPISTIVSSILTIFMLAYTALLALAALTAIRGGGTGQT